MADGPITVPAPKVAAGEFNQERAPILCLRTVVTIVAASRGDGATRKLVQVWVVGVNLLWFLLLSFDLKLTDLQPRELTQARLWLLLITHWPSMLQKWTADGPITVPAPKVVAAECKQERAPILQAVKKVKELRANGDTHKPVQVLELLCSSPH